MYVMIEPILVNTYIRILIMEFLCVNILQRKVQYTQFVFSNF